ncbi:complement factor H isoform X2 [Hyla sarda]|uniref:complement factor H isoform X2 n=1 Tax=Hyla sarda TaxID=327740 RepID=UPI0024C3EBEE|nr:complement factor H isoform X2 [Hyla sarda]
MSLLGYFLLLTAALCCTAAPASDGSCLRPERRESEELTGDWEKDSFPPGTTATYQCRPGYSRLGTIKIVCLEGRWQDVGRRGQCRKKSCGHPGDIPFGSFQLTEGESFVFGAIVEYSCDDGYQMVSKEKTRQCTANGWSNYPPHCEVRNCPPVEAEANVNVLSTSYDEEYSVGQVVRFECKDPNLKLEGASEIYCTSEGGWNLEPPKCVVIRCRPPTIDNGKVNEPKKGVYNNNDAIQITCNEGFSPRTSRDIKCTKDGWTPNPSCEEIFCSAYSSVTNGKLVGTKPSYKYGEEIKVECDDGYVLQTEPDKLRKCTSNGWSPSPVCVSKTCDRPYINHGSMYYNYNFPRRLGTSVDYRCERNYLSHQREYWGRIYCTDLGWNPEPKCSRQCANYKANVENADLINPQYDYMDGEKVQFRCKSTFQTPDVKTDGERTCLPNGEFTPAKCSRFCKAPELPDGKFRPIKNVFDLREVLQYECNKGFMTESRKLSSSASCLDRGWSEEPRCIPITCKQGHVSYNDGDVIKYTCPRGQRPESESGQCYYFGIHPPPKCLDITCTIPDTSNLILSPHQSSYQSGRRVSFSCKEGFVRDGSLESVCKKEGWNPPLPTCKEVKPQATDSPTDVNKNEEIKCTISEKANLIRKPTKLQYLQNDEVSLNCEEGFIRKGPKTTTCTANGWNPPLPTCDNEQEPLDPPTDDNKNQEKIIKCPHPYIPIHAEIKDRKEEYYTNDNVTMTCERGYKMNGSPVIRCIEGKWDTPPECIQLTQCRSQPKIDNGDITESSKKETYVTDDIVIFSCKRGFHLTGPEESMCVNGQWTAFPTCTENPCDAPPEVLHATVVDKKESFNHGERAKYECENGFRFSGTDSASCIMGRWTSPPNCVATSCPPPPKVKDSKIHGQSKQNYASGEKVTYICNPGFALERSLTGEVLCENTQWKNVPVCRKTGEQCDPPPVVQYGDTISFNKPFYKSGESVEYKCPEYYILKGNRVVRCLNGVWDEAPVCLEPCTAKEKEMKDNNIKLRWRPDPKLYSEHGDKIDFQCLNGYEAPPGTQMKITCEQGKLEYPKCFKAGFCVLDQPTMITRNIHYNVSTIVDNEQAITFQCIEGTIPETNLEAKCKSKMITYPKCTASKSCATPKIENAFLKTEPQDSYDSGSHIEFECKEDHVINGPINVKCENGQWTELPVCYRPCKISTADLTKSNIQLLPSDSNPDITHIHGTRFSVTCKSGFRRPNQAALGIECSDGKFRYPRCFSGKTCRIDQDELDENNLELDEVHDNEVYYEENESVHFQCKTGYYLKTRPIGKCSGETLIYPSCTAQSSV